MKVLKVVLPIIALATVCALFCGSSRTDLVPLFWGFLPFPLLRFDWLQGKAAYESTAMWSQPLIQAAFLATPLYWLSLWRENQPALQYPEIRSRMILFFRLCALALTISIIDEILIRRCAYDLRIFIPAAIVPAALLCLHGFLPGSRLARFSILALLPLCLLSRHPWAKSTLFSLLVVFLLSHLAAVLIAPISNVFSFKGKKTFFVLLGVLWLWYVLTMLFNVTADYGNFSIRSFGLAVPALIIYGWLRHRAVVQSGLSRLLLFAALWSVLVVGFVIWESRAVALPDEPRVHAIECYLQGKKPVFTNVFTRCERSVACLSNDDAKSCTDDRSCEGVCMKSAEEAAYYHDQAGTCSSLMDPEKLHGRGSRFYGGPWPRGMEPCYADGPIAGYIPGFLEFCLALEAFLGGILLVLSGFREKHIGLMVRGVLLSAAGLLVCLVILALLREGLWASRDSASGWDRSSRNSASMFQE